MAELIVLSPAELAERDQPQARGRSGRRRSEARNRIIETYKASLQAASPGYGGEVLLEEGEQKREVRLNLQAAAQELGFVLDFRPVKDATRLQFRVITPEARAARPRRGGRPRNQQSVDSEQRGDSEQIASDEQPSDADQTSPGEQSAPDEQIALGEQPSPGESIVQSDALAEDKSSASAPDDEGEAPKRRRRPRRTEP